VHKEINGEILPCRQLVTPRNRGRDWSDIYLASRWRPWEPGSSLGSFVRHPSSLRWRRGAGGSLVERRGGCCCCSFCLRWHAKKKRKGEKRAWSATHHSAAACLLPYLYHLGPSVRRRCQPNGYRRMYNYISSVIKYFYFTLIFIIYFIKNIKVIKN
jgi:hypothetical protein